MNSHRQAPRPGVPVLRSTVMASSPEIDGSRSTTMLVSDPRRASEMTASAFPSGGDSPELVPRLASVGGGVGPADQGGRDPRDGALARARWADQQQDLVLAGEPDSR